MAAARPDLWDGGGDFPEELCMISGSHSSTLDRLYAWERKLHDEVKVSNFFNIKNTFFSLSGLDQETMARLIFE